MSATSEALAAVSPPPPPTLVALPRYLSVALFNEEWLSLVLQQQGVQTLCILLALSLAAMRLK